MPCAASRTSFGFCNTVGALETHGFEVGRRPELPPRVNTVSDARLGDDDWLADARMPLDGLRNHQFIVTSQGKEGHQDKIWSPAQGKVAHSSWGE